MGRVAYDIDGAAEATAVSVGTLTIAIRNRELPAYQVDGQAVMLSEDLRDWVKTHPRFNA